MKNLILITVTFIALSACSTSKNIEESTRHTLLDENTFKLTEVSTDPTYGYSAKNPVEVGSEGGGPRNERRYLNALTGPNGEGISYYRASSCCPIKSENAMFGNHVMLDLYKVTWEGASDTFSIYINMYDAGELKAPKGFGIRAQ